MAAYAQLRTFKAESILLVMDRLEAYRSWWRPLPAWLKLVTAAGFYPAWLFIIYCVLIGAAKSVAALIAFGICLVVALLHIAFDRRNRDGIPERGGIDFIGGE